jgi:hypothetical protein
MEVDNGDTVGAAAFFPIDGMDIRHLEVARLVCRKGRVKGFHFKCVLMGLNGMSFGSMFSRKNISKVSGNLKSSNNFQRQTPALCGCVVGDFANAQAFQATIFLAPQSPGEFAVPKRPILPDDARVGLYLISPALKIVVQWEEKGNRSAECS